MFNSYVKLPEGNVLNLQILPGLGGFSVSPVPWPSCRASGPPRLPAAAAAASAPPEAPPAPGAAAAARAAPGATTPVEPWQPMGTLSWGKYWGKLVGNSIWSYDFELLKKNPDKILFIFDSVMCSVDQGSHRPEQTEPVIFHSSMYTPYTLWQKPMLNRLSSQKRKKNGRGSLASHV